MNAIALELTARWRLLLPESPELGAALVAAYSEPSRRYHNAQHLLAVLDAVTLLAADASNPRPVELAAWFHDAVYDVRATDNEERSAGWAASALPLAGVASTVTGEVVRLVRLTTTHAPTPDDADGIVLCDADLAILAGEPAAYDAYTRAVRAEYAHVSDGDFRRGRAAVLRELLALPTLYGTAHGRSHWEQRARDNLTHELAQVQASDPA